MSITPATATPTGAPQNIQRERGGEGCSQTVQNVLSPSAKPLQQASIHWGESSPAFPQRHPASQRAPEGLEANWEWAPWWHRPDTPVISALKLTLTARVWSFLTCPAPHHSQCVDVQPKHLWCLWKDRRGWSKAHRKRRVGFKGLASLQKQEGGWGAGGWGVTICYYGIVRGERVSLHICTYAQSCKKHPSADSTQHRKYSFAVQNMLN